MAVGPEPQRGEEQSLRQEFEGDATGGHSVSPDILGQIVAETTSSLARAEAADPELKSAMLAVAGEHAGQPLVVDGTGTALIAAVLRAQFAALASRPALVAKTARAVAASLLADPAARLRLEHLWAKLQEEAA